MGIKDILAIAFAALLIGALVYAGHRYFVEKRAEHTREMMQTELGWLAENALRYYYAPKTLGGGDRSFLNFENAPAGKRKVGKPRANRKWVGTAAFHTLNGTYSVIQATKDSVIIEGVGDRKGDDGINPIRVRAVVQPTNIRYQKVN